MFANLWGKNAPTVAPCGLLMWHQNSGKHASSSHRTVGTGPNTLMSANGILLHRSSPVLQAQDKTIGLVNNWGVVWRIISLCLPSRYISWEATTDMPSMRAWDVPVRAWGFWSRCWVCGNSWRPWESQASYSSPDYHVLNHLGKSFFFHI